MVARAQLASLALLAVAATAACAQNAVIYVNVANETHLNLVARQQDSILAQLQTVKADAVSLYTDFASRAAKEMKNFSNNITGFASAVMKTPGVNAADDFLDECQTKLKYRLKKIEHDAHRAASYCGDSHHKYLLGHMIVFRMHINKSEDYLKKCDKVLRDCGPSCETTPRVKRWHRLAIEEIHRVREDIQHSRKSYRDLVSHARRKLNHLRKHTVAKGKAAVEEYNHCIMHS